MIKSKCKKPMMILKEFIFFVLVSTSGASDWQACEDSHWNKRTTFVFHKIVIYNPWTWKLWQSEDSLKVSLTPKRSEFTGVQKFFLLWCEIGDKIDHYISYRVLFLSEAAKGAGDWRNYRLTKNQITRTQIILATDFPWIFKEQFSFKFQDNLKSQNKYYVLKCESYTSQNW